MDRSVDFAGICFVLILIMVVVAVSYGIGLMNNDAKIQQVLPSYHYGDIPIGMPIWAVYDNDGVLESISAIKAQDGRLFEFNIFDAPIKFYELHEPDAWTELSAGILEVIK